jgi:hypothetical protein
MPTRGKVLILNEEVRRQALRRTLISVAAGLGHPEAAVEKALHSGRIVTVSQAGVRLDGEAWLSRLQYLLQRSQKVLLIADSWRYLLGDIDENSSMGLKLLRGLDHVLKLGDHTALIIAHDGKGAVKNPRGMDSIAGSNVLPGWADVTLQFRRKKPKQSREVTVLADKGRDQASVVQPIRLRFTQRGVGRALLPPPPKRQTLSGAVSSSSPAPQAKPSPSVAKVVSGGAGGVGRDPSSVELSEFTKRVDDLLRQAGKPVVKNYLRKALGKPTPGYPRINRALEELKAAGRARPTGERWEACPSMSLPSTPEALPVGDGGSVAPP